MKSNIVAILPARMASSRFQGKPLAKIWGIPMIGHVYFRTKMCKILDGVYVATPDQEIFDYVKSIGGVPIMTLPTHEMCTDRVTEAALKIEDKMKKKLDIVVNVQGDQPMVFPKMLDDVVKPLLDDESLLCASMMSQIKTFEEHDDPNKVKVIVDLNNYAMYFTREPIPSRKKCSKNIPMYKHVALTAFRRDFLIKFTNLEMTPLETVESIDNIRALEYGYKIKMVLTDYATDTVDTPEDLERVEKMMENDPLIPMYK